MKNACGLLMGSLCLVLLVSAPTFAHTRGHHAGDWTAKQIIKVCVDTPPGTEAEQAVLNAAVTAAMTAWNDSKAGFNGGVTFELATENCDVQISWAANRTSWGSVVPATGPVPVEIESNDGLNARGFQRVLLHEFGHVKGLGHSGLSDIMKRKYRGTGGNSPTTAELNGADAFEDPNDDDKALNKILHGNEAPCAKANATGTATPETEKLWKYDYSLQGIDEPGLVCPVTRFTLELPFDVVFPGDFEVTQTPSGWQWEVIEGQQTDGAGKPLETEEGSQPALLTFWTSDPAAGVFPGESASLQLISSLPPRNMRAYTNSPNFDSDEFTLLVPGAEAIIPTLSEWGLIVLAVLLMTAGAVVFGRQRRPAAA